MLVFPCKAAYVPGVSRVNGELLALLVRSSAGTCQELGPLSCSRVFNGAEKTVSHCNTHTHTHTRCYLVLHVIWLLSPLKATMSTLKGSLCVFSEIRHAEQIIGF